MFSINAALCACASERTMLDFKFRQHFSFMILYRFIGVNLARRILDAERFMVKMGSFVR